jgi:hypothetical protein
MRKIVATGEAILDIVFINQKDIVAVPGGSAFNTLVSLARTGLSTTFVGEVGMDHVGEIIRTFMEDNCMNTDYLHQAAGMQTPVSEVGARYPVRIFINVDFPAPFGPNNPNTSPRCTEKLTLSSAFWAPYIFDIFSTHIISCSNYFQNNFSPSTQET